LLTVRQHHVDDEQRVTQVGFAGLSLYMGETLLLCKMSSGPTAVLSSKYGAECVSDGWEGRFIAHEVTRGQTAANGDVAGFDIIGPVF
jgi:hypothetical protein